MVELANAHITYKLDYEIKEGDYDYCAEITNEDGSSVGSGVVDLYEDKTTRQRRSLSRRTMYFACLCYAVGCGKG